MWPAATRSAPWSTPAAALTASPWARSTRPTCGRWGEAAAAAVTAAAAAARAAARGAGAVRRHRAAPGGPATGRCPPPPPAPNIGHAPPPCSPGAQVGKEVRAKRKEDEIPLDPFTAGVYVATMMATVQVGSQPLASCSPPNGPPATQPATPSAPSDPSSCLQTRPQAARPFAPPHATAATGPHPAACPLPPWMPPPPRPPPPPPHRPPVPPSLADPAREGPLLQRDLQ